MRARKQTEGIDGAIVARRRELVTAGLQQGRWTPEVAALGLDLASKRGAQALADEEWEAFLDGLVTPDGV